MNSIRKITIATVLIISMLASLTACAGSGQTTAQSTAAPPPPPDVASGTSEEPTQSEAQVVPEPSDEPVPALDYALDTYTYTQTTGDGYILEYTLKIGSWIKASDTEMLDSAWSSVGGKKDTPYVDIFGDTIVKDAFRSDRSVIAFGTLTLNNITEGFDITAEYPLTVYTRISGPGIQMFNTLGYWNVMLDLSERKVYNGSRAVVGINAVMKQNTWHVPIAMSISNVFNPKYPDGNPQLGNVAFSFGFAGTRDTIYIKPIWAASRPGRKKSVH